MGIPVLDLFAGPGGLGEGFSSLINSEGHRVFDIRLSIEMDKHAHETLLFRSFFRQFKPGEVPNEYYDVIRENDKKLRLQKKGQLFRLYPEEAIRAENEAWRCELGGSEFPPEEVDRRIHKALGDDIFNQWVLIGGPPCQAYSMAGRSRVGGINEKDHRVYLYKEYLRIIAAHQPSVFVMENVRGLLSAKLDGKSIFEMILNDLRDPASVFTKYIQSKKYKIFSFVNEPDIDSKSGDPIYSNYKDYLIRAEKYGIPQNRQRVIILGVREDCNCNTPDILQQVSQQITLQQVINNLPPLRSGISKRILNTYVLNNRKRHNYQKINDSPEVWAQIIDRSRKELKLPISKPVKMMETGRNYIKTKIRFDNDLLDDWYVDRRLKGVCNHESRNHLESDLKRYLFAAEYVKKNNGIIPRLKDFPENLLPEHRSASSGKFVDRFRVQIPDKPATTITCHISKDGHYFIHYDPEQCRSLTVREAARIQTFPDNYYFWGDRTTQYHQVGNAVPPMLAMKLAEVVRNMFNN